MVSFFTAAMFWLYLTNQSQSHPIFKTDVVKDVILPWCPGWGGELLATRGGDRN